MDVLALMLADSRFPGGGHVHSGGLEEAASRGLIRAEDDLPAFLTGRLRTAGTLDAVFAAASAHCAARNADLWSIVDAELDARIPSAAQRSASRTHGQATARAARIIPTVDSRYGAPLRSLLSATSRPHHAVVLGCVVGACGGAPVDAALAAAYLSVSGPASAAVRLLGLDPLRVNGIVAAMAPILGSVAADAAECAGLDPAQLPAPGAPGLDLLAEEHGRHHREEVRLFAS